MSATSLKARIDISRDAVSSLFRALQASKSNATDAAILPQLLPGLADTYRQLLAQLRLTVTSLGIAVNPPAAVPAAEQQLEKLDEQLGKLASCAIAASTGEAWEISQLASEWRDGVLSIGGELSRFLDVVSKDLHGVESTPASSSKDENPYALHVGVVWGAIDRTASGLSTTEVAAIVKVLKAQQALIKDAWDEFKEALETDENDDNTSPDEEDEDEWGELERGLQGGSAMNNEERDTAEAAKPLLGLYMLLHASLPRHLPVVTTNPPTTFLAVVLATKALVAAYDESVSALEPKQDMKEVVSGMEKLRLAAIAVMHAVQVRFSDERRLEQQSCQEFLLKWEKKHKAEVQNWRDQALASTLQQL